MEDCIGHVQKRLGTALHSYKKKRRGAVLSAGKGTGSKDVTDPIIYCMLTAIHNNKGDQVSSIAASWAIYHHMIMGPPEGSILIAQIVIKLGLSTTKIKYVTGIYMISQNVYYSCFAASFMSCGPNQNQNESINNNKNRFVISVCE